MSRENVEVVHRAYDALARRDLHSFLELMHPEVEATSRILEADGAVYKGRGGMRSFIEGVWSVFPDWRPEILETREVGNAVVVAVRNSGTGVESGVEVAMTGWQAIRLKEGKPIWVRGFGTEAEALEAVGLSE